MRTRLDSRRADYRGYEEPAPGSGRAPSTLQNVGAAIFFALVLRIFVAEAFEMEASADIIYDAGPSDRFAVLKPAYLFKGPARGDLVMFSRQGGNYFSRVIGLEGEHLHLSPGGTRVDGRLLPEKYVLTQWMGSHDAVVPRRHVFVSADDRSADNAGSLFWGCIPYDEIKGKFVYRYWPLRRAGRFIAP